MHLEEADHGQTYAQLSVEARADPTKLAGQVATAFQGETLRDPLLNAYAFGTMGEIAGIAAIASFIVADLVKSVVARSGGANRYFAQLPSAGPIVAGDRSNVLAAGRGDLRPLP